MRIIECWREMPNPLAKESFFKGWPSTGAAPAAFFYAGNVKTKIRCEIAAQ